VTEKARKEKPLTVERATELYKFADSLAWPLAAAALREALDGFAYANLRLRALQTYREVDQERIDYQTRRAEEAERKSASFERALRQIVDPKTTTSCSTNSHSVRVVRSFAERALATFDEDGRESGKSS
jgi:hypothetical protein